VAEALVACIELEFHDARLLVAKFFFFFFFFFWDTHRAHCLFCISRYIGKIEDAIFYRKQSEACQRSKGQ